MDSKLTKVSNFAGMHDHEESNLLDFYRGKSVLVTGGTGFLGKTLCEKLLRSTDIKNLYLLMRPKKGISPKERLNTLLDQTIFQLMKSTKPEVVSKITVVPGDICVENLGLSNEDFDELVNNVEIIFHCAATVNFNENLKVAMNVNFQGTQRVLDLAERANKLQAFIYVSTAFSNSHLKVIDEVVYPALYPPEDLKKLCDSISPEIADKIHSHIIGCSPNTYTFMKQVSETLVKKYQHLPVAIFRPGIVLATLNDPMEGWIDNKYGPTGIIMGIITGFIHCVILSKPAKSDIVPVDTTINCLIATAWETAERQKLDTKPEIPVFNYTPTKNCCLTWGKLLDGVVKNSRLAPPLAIFWYIFVISMSNTKLHYLMTYILHFTPGYICDVLLSFTGHKRSILSTYRKVYKYSIYLERFANNEWTYKSTNTQALWEKMGTRERQKFPFKLDNIDWEKFVANYVVGVKKYLLKEETGKENSGRKKYNRFQLVHRLGVALMFCVSCRLFLAVLIPIQNAYFSKTFV